MNEINKKGLAKIMAGMKCPKDFKCAAAGFKRLCKATDLGLERYLHCLEEDSTACSFALPFGSMRYCQCPLRVHLAKTLEGDGMSEAKRQQLLKNMKSAQTALDCAIDKYDAAINSAFTAHAFPHAFTQTVHAARAAVNATRAALDATRDVVNRFDSRHPAKRAEKSSPQKLRRKRKK